MGVAKNRKLCWSCDGEVPLESVHCPYCGNQLMATSTESTHSAYRAPQQPNPLFEQPPYNIPTSQPVSDKEWSDTFNRQASSQVEAPPIANESSSEESSVGITLALLLPGMTFLFFAIVVLCFSKEGVLTLQWKQSSWIVYFVLAIPFLLLFWRRLRRG